MKLISSILISGLGLVAARRAYNDWHRYEIVEYCQDRDFDLFVVLDGSSSIQGNDFRKSVDLIEHAVEMMPIGYGKSQLTLSQYAYDTESPAEPYVIEETSKSTINRELRSIRHIRGGTETGVAMRKMFGYMKDSARKNRRNGRTLKQIMVVLTDGMTHPDDRDNLENISEQIHDYGSNGSADVLAIGVGPYVNKDELYQIASRSDYVLRSDSYADLESQILKALSVKICELVEVPVKYECNCDNGIGLYMFECPVYDACANCYEGYALNSDGECVPKCRARTLDFHFVFDGSDGLGAYNVRQAFEFVNSNIYLPYMAADGSRASLYMYNDQVYEYLTNSHDVYEISDTLADMGKVRQSWSRTFAGEDSNTGDMLEHLYDTLKNDYSRHSMTKSIVLFFTNGYSNDRVKAAAERLHSLDDVTVAVMGLSNSHDDVCDNNGFQLKNLELIASPATSMFETVYYDFPSLNEQTRRSVFLEIC